MVTTVPRPAHRATRRDFGRVERNRCAPGSAGVREPGTVGSPVPRDLDERRADGAPREPFDQHCSRPPDAMDAIAATLLATL